MPKRCCEARMMPACRQCACMYWLCMRMKSPTLKWEAPHTPIGPGEGEER
jgi:hypothetical protein